MTSSFTLSSGTTNNSSASYALSGGKPHEHPCNNAFAVQLKKLYYNISNEELWAVYHCVKSNRPFSTSSWESESVLPIWSSSAQSRRLQPDA
ncbi:hypothetical protein M405DRAFT_869698 [Rhizopogon salebrosus TDB-379]|nr:hypothetical protein M405DRAFT_869698 [Rhizopogon salebrosus TDB-379]